MERKGRESERERMECEKRGEEVRNGTEANGGQGDE